MKNLIKLLPVAAGIVALTGCVNDDIPGLAGGRVDYSDKYVLEVNVDQSVEETETRAFWNNSSSTVADVFAFGEGEALRVYDGYMQKYDDFKFDGTYFTIGQKEARVALDGYKYALHTEGGCVSFAGWNDYNMALMKIESNAIDYAEKDKDGTMVYKHAIPMWGGVEASDEEGNTLLKTNLHWLTTRARVIFENGKQSGVKAVRAYSVKVNENYSKATQAEAYVENLKTATTFDSPVLSKVNENSDEELVIFDPTAEESYYVANEKAPLSGTFEAKLENEDDGLRVLNDASGIVFGNNESFIQINLTEEVEKEEGETEEKTLMDSYTSVVYIPITFLTDKENGHDKILFEYQDAEGNWRFLRIFDFAGSVAKGFTRNSTIGGMTLTTVMDAGTVNSLVDLNKVIQDAADVDADMTVNVTLADGVKSYYSPDPKTNTLYVPANLTHNVILNISGIIKGEDEEQDKLTIRAADSAKELTGRLALVVKNSESFRIEAPVVIDNLAGAKLVLDAMFDKEITTADEAGVKSLGLGGTFNENVDVTVEELTLGDAKFESGKTLKVDGNVTVAENATVNGSITATDVTVNGTVKANEGEVSVTASGKVTVSENGKVYREWTEETKNVNLIVAEYDVEISGDVTVCHTAAVNKFYHYAGVQTTGDVTVTATGSVGKINAKNVTVNGEIGYRKGGSPNNSLYTEVTASENVIINSTAQVAKNVKINAEGNATVTGVAETNVIDFTELTVKGNAMLTNAAVTTLSSEGDVTLTESTVAILTANAASMKNITIDTNIAGETLSDEACTVGKLSIESAAGAKVNLNNGYVKTIGLTTEGKSVIATKGTSYIGEIVGTPKRVESAYEEGKTVAFGKDDSDNADQIVYTVSHLMAVAENTKKKVNNYDATPHQGFTIGADKIDLDGLDWEGITVDNYGKEYVLKGQPASGATAATIENINLTGNGFINSLKVNKQEVSNSSISNIKLNYVTYTGTDESVNTIGGLIGEVDENVDIENVDVRVTIEGDKDSYNLGGLIGTVKNGKTTLENVTVAARLTGHYNIGYVIGSIANSAQAEVKGAGMTSNTTIGNSANGGNSEIIVTGIKNLDNNDEGDENAGKVGIFVGSIGGTGELTIASEAKVNATVKKNAGTNWYYNKQMKLEQLDGNRVKIIRFKGCYDNTFNVGYSADDAKYNDETNFNLFE